MRRSRSVSHGGALSSENADISSVSACEIQACRKLKVSAAMSIICGLVGSKPFIRSVKERCTNG